MQVCQAPFGIIEIGRDGSIRPCCSAYTDGKFLFGNIFEQEFDDVWHGSKAVAIRKKILAGDYSDCNLGICINDLTKPVQYVDNSFAERPEYPSVVKFCHDDACNYACITCRDSFIKLTPEKKEKLDAHIESKFLPVLKNAKIVILSGSGEPFASQHTLRLIEAIRITYPDIVFSFHTNGSLCSKDKLALLKIEQQVKEIYVSLHAATVETYKTITRCGNLNRVLKNMASLAPLVESGQLNLHFYFVVSRLNFMEMPAFAAMAKKYHADATFWECRDWGTDFCATLHEHDLDFLKRLKIMVDKTKTYPNAHFTQKLLRLTDAY